MFDDANLIDNKLDASSKNAKEKEISAKEAQSTKEKMSKVGRK